jgi:hypothetical protein
LKGRASQRLYIVGVDSIKSLLFQRLKRGQSVRFSNTLDGSYFARPGRRIKKGGAFLRPDLMRMIVESANNQAWWNSRAAWFASGAAFAQALTILI